MTLEAASSGREIRVGELWHILEPARIVLAAQPYFGGHTPVPGKALGYSI